MAWSGDRGILKPPSQNFRSLLTVGRQMEDPQIHRLGVALMPKTGGGSGIRTHDTVAHIAVFKTAAFVHSAIPPC